SAMVRSPPSFAARSTALPLGQGDGELLGAPVETTIVTVVPGWASTPLEGVWSLTTPLGTVELGTWSTTTAKPAPWSAATAWDWPRPVTLGTVFAEGLVVGVGPFETVIATADPAGAVRPALGAWSTTVPDGPLEL